MKNRMYADVKTWNSFVGCKFDCSYCKPSFQRMMKRVSGANGCRDCYSFKPHEHPERLSKIPSADTVFVCGTGDISFANPKYVRKIISAIKDRIKKHLAQQFYFQSKNPACFQQYLSDFPKDNTILLTTLETNRDEGYAGVSKAPVPSRRYADFKALDWLRKIITVEPVIDFDHDIFLEWIVDLKPEAVWIGYNSRPKEVQFPEPDKQKLEKLIAAIRDAGVEVKEKDMRG
ncbi:MAG: hypothetical protein A2252_01530 [Elusimicrobia bacterium RIFOXYA2_FULL_39_19]|nr:MAG: hypothetical protein A2252_01530 [Elusimicrobia bacterium RIFOXYA2_FULL_39_19]